MEFLATAIPGVWIVEPQRRPDERGFFARTWSRRMFAERGLATDLDECATSFSHRRGTLRGLHYQVAPHAQTKLIRCTHGAIFDVAVDLRPGSRTLNAWYGAELSADNGRMLYVPAGCAHGYLTLADATEVFYQMSACHSPESERGVRWDDPALAIRWPAIGVRVISPRDRRLPLLTSTGALSDCPTLAAGTHR